MGSLFRKPAARQGEEPRAAADLPEILDIAELETLIDSCNDELNRLTGGRIGTNLRLQERHEDLVAKCWQAVRSLETVRNSMPQYDARTALQARAQLCLQAGGLCLYRPKFKDTIQTRMERGREVTFIGASDYDIDYELTRKFLDFALRDDESFVAHYFMGVTFAEMEEKDRALHHLGRAEELARSRGDAQAAEQATTMADKVLARL